MEKRPSSSIIEQALQDQIKSLDKIFARTETRIETALKDQTLYIERIFREQSSDLNNKISTNNRWLIGLAIAVAASLTTAVISNLLG